VLETKARLAECVVLDGDFAAALKQADETLEAIRHAGTGPGLRSMLYRIRGYALLQRGDADAAESALEESVRIAREADASYELAQSGRARARLRAQRGAESADDERGAAELLEQLGVVSLPDVPLTR
jgi:ATP/maltotriose-dependent transcriptional regulator MalT